MLTITPYRSTYFGNQTAANETFDLEKAKQKHALRLSSFLKNPTEFSLVKVYATAITNFEAEMSSLTMTLDQAKQFMVYMFEQHEAHQLSQYDTDTSYKGKKILTPNLLLETGNGIDILNVVNNNIDAIFESNTNS